jgi:hypothetical protein
MRRLSVVFLALALVATTACAGPLTTREQGAAIGAATGAAAGAAIGQVFGRPGLGAAIGAAAGTVGGWIAGDHAAAARQRQAAMAPAPPPAYPLAPTAPAGDPTAGAIVNQTPWTVELTIASTASPEQQQHWVLPPHARIEHALDIGHYRFVAQATVQTRFGPRPVGRVERTFEIDPKRQGWRLELNPYDFR